MKSVFFGAVSATALIASAVHAEPQAEVLHWWTSGGEAKSVAVLQEEFASKGGQWTDMPVAGGGGDAAMTALRARVLSGNAPTAVQLKGPAIQEGTKRVFWLTFRPLPKRRAGQTFCLRPSQAT